MKHIVTRCKLTRTLGFCGGDEKEKASPGGDDDDDEARVIYQRRVHRRD